MRNNSIYCLRSFIFRFILLGILPYKTGTNNRTRINLTTYRNSSIQPYTSPTTEYSNPTRLRSNCNMSTSRPSTQATQGLFFTVLLGLYFTPLQAYEYLEAPFTIADPAYGSKFSLWQQNFTDYTQLLSTSLISPPMPFFVPRCVVTFSFPLHSLQKWKEDEEEGVRSYWMTLRTGEDTVNWRRTL